MFLWTMVLPTKAIDKDAQVKPGAPLPEYSQAGAIPTVSPRVH